MFKKTISFLISLFMILAFIPIKSGAVDIYPVWIEGRQVTSINNHGKGWTYTSTGLNTGTLRLSNANLHSPAEANDNPNMPYNSAIGFGVPFADYPGFNLKIILDGDNCIHGTLGISAINSSLTIMGRGSLNATCSSVPIWAHKDIIIHHTEVNVFSNSGGGIYAGCNLTVSGDSLVTAEININSPTLYGTLTASGNSRFGILDLQDGLKILDPFRGGVAGISERSNTITIVNPEGAIAPRVVIMR